MGLKSAQVGWASAGILAAVLTASTTFNTADPPSRDQETISDYGVCRGTDRSCYNDWRAEYADDGETRVLVYSRTVGPRHDHLGTPLEPGLNPPLNDDNVAQAAMVQWGEEYGFSVDWTEDVDELGSARSLRSYDVVVFLSSTRDTLDDNAQTGLMQYIRGGGGFAGIHNAFGTEYHWKWYEGLLGGTNFYDHGPLQPATVKTETKRDASTAHLPKRWEFADEWYNLQPYPSKVRTLLSVDESTMEEGTEGGLGHPGHGREHPVSWCHYYDGGRAFLTTLGHDVALWTEGDLVGGQEVKEHIVQGVLSAAGAEHFCR